MSGGRAVGWCSVIVSGVLLAGCGRASRNAGAEGTGGTLDTSSAGGSRTGSAGSAVAGNATRGGVAGTATGAGGANSAGAEVGGAAEEPSTLEDGGQGGLAAVDPLDWRLELELIDPTQQQLEAAESAGVEAWTGIVAVTEDGARVLATATFPGPDQSDGTLLLTELIGWTKEHGSVSLGGLEGLEPEFNPDAPHQFSMRYIARGWTKDLKVVAGAVDGSVVGHAFVWREGEGMTELPLPGAPTEVQAKLSDDGKVVVVVARDSNGGHRTFRFDSSGRTDLGTLPGFDSLEATYLSPDGSRVIGDAWKSNCQTGCSVPFSWQLGGVPQAFELPAGAHDCFTVRSTRTGRRSMVVQCTSGNEPTPVVWAEGLGWLEVGAPNANGFVGFLAHDGSAAVGLTFSNEQVWRWDAATGTTLLSLPAGLTFNELIAVSEDSATALVQVENAGYRRITLSWSAGSEPLALPPPPGGLWPTARSMSADATRIIGWASGVGGANVLWVDGRPYFLEQLFAPSGVDLTGVLSEKISDGGRIVTGSRQTGGVARVVRAWFTHLP